MTISIMGHKDISKSASCTPYHRPEEAEGTNLADPNQGSDISERITPLFKSPTYPPGSPIADGQWIGQDLLLAARFGTLKTVRKLLCNGAITEQERGLAVIQASTSGNLQKVQELLGNGSAQITEEHRGQAVVIAARSGNLQMILELLANGAQISVYHRGMAVRNASTCRSLRIVRELLRSGAITEEDRGLALVQASTQNNLKMIRELLGNGSAQITEEQRGLAVVQASTHGNLKMIRELLGNGSAQITEEQRGLAVENAAISGKPEVIHELLANGAQISKYHRGMALQAASQYGHEPVIQALASIPSIEPLWTTRFVWKPKAQQEKSQAEIAQRIEANKRRPKASRIPQLWDPCTRSWRSEEEIEAEWLDAQKIEDKTSFLDRDDWISNTPKASDTEEMLKEFRETKKAKRARHSSPLAF